jgi:flagellar motility protein MotE (MotC chaperone)
VPKVELTMWECGKCFVCWEEIEWCGCNNGKLRKGAGTLERKLLEKEQELRNLRDEYSALEEKQRLLMKIAANFMAQIESLRFKKQKGEIDDTK